MNSLPSRVAPSRVTASIKKKTDKPKSIAPESSTFGDLGIDPWLVETLQAMQIKQPTEIQRACIPPILAGKDVIGGAKTGSGKTAAFALPILQKLSEDPYGVFAVVLTPTRELAYQIAEQFRVLGKGIGLKECVVVGGMDMMTQALELAKRPHVIIATPGRLRDHIHSSSGAVDLTRAKYLVMDEADRLLSSTFVSELGVIFSKMPTKRQTLLFTATMTDSILALQEAQKDPKKKPYVHVCAMDTHTVATLDQFYVFVPSQVRPVYLVRLLRSDEFKDKSVIIFCGRCSTAEMVTGMLKELGIRCTALHSEMSQQQRLDSLGKFRAEVIKVLVSTDVGSRGLDIPSVELVLNFDIPRDPTDYIHRVGRTARAGRGGQSLCIVSEKDVQLIQNIEAKTNTKMEEYELNENVVLKDLNEVTEAKRVATMQMHDSKFGERKNVHKKKKLTHTT
ncbi:P-loop containing nucleoside triphosphate hydrolase protein [Halteromyces radiatus]|uniref:P-loop containing nucleoside triphosphate hydrolase protein n=1 Tax=Halteromyces radiatus TaxID=101107 RepID=UPI002220C0ED|nr:P-loop containing nucleoside triphosphate hydrolase protein [Halteromyces radiatus]KAI8099920.1 P-loop containing nucleoside triphosphate hydrolase protein [Halteromyces radiatus]